MADETAGDPMGSLKWTRKSTRKASRELQRRRIAASPRTVARLLKKQMHFSLKGNRKSIAGTQDPDRDQQFRYIAKMREHFAATGEPEISIDAKKKELIGNFYNSGRSWCRQAENVNDHDFRSASIARATPYGIYDGRANQGFVVVGTSHDTADFAVDNIASWLKISGTTRYPEIQELLILCDTGGSNGYRYRAWKYAIQKRLCNPFGIAVTVCHYPTGASKWNPVEHRLFSHMSINWAGKPLRSLKIMLNYIRTTKTQTGLTVRARLNKKNYPTRRKIDDAQMAEINIRRLDVLPNWNYTIYPTGYVWNSKSPLSKN
jgi:hypothetical protein